MCIRDRYYFVERSVYQPNPDGHGGHYVRKNVKKRLINKQYLIVARGAAKSMYASTLQGYFLNVDTSTKMCIRDRIYSGSHGAA